MYIHVCTFMKIPVCVMYINGNLHIYICTWYIHVYTYSNIRHYFDSFQPVNFGWIIAVCITTVLCVEVCIKSPPKSLFPSQHGIYMYIHVYIMYRHSKYLYVLCSQPHFISNQALSALRRRRVSAPCSTSTFWVASFLSSVSSTDRPPRRGLPHANRHSHWFTSYTLLPRWPSAAAV